MKWIQKHKFISIVTVIILVLVIVFGVSAFRNFSGGSDENGTVINSGVGSVSGKLNSINVFIKEKVSGAFSYVELQKQIEELEAENQELKAQLAAEQLQREELEDLQALSEAMNTEYTKRKFTLIAADVSSYDGSNFTNVFTINKGTADGVRQGDAVVNGDGLVGQVKECGKNWAKVVSIIDVDANISFKLERDRKQRGISSGTRNGTVTGYMMDAESTVQEGDIILTSGMGSYPSGLVIGNIKSVTYNENTLLREVVIEPAVEFRSLAKVAVIR